MNSAVHFNNTMRNPSTWLLRADALRDAARPLGELLPRVTECWNSKDFSEKAYQLYFSAQAYYMLWAYAIENLLKARIVAKNPVWFTSKDSPTSEIPRSLKSHQIAKLAKESNSLLAFDQAEDLMHKLTECSIWFGRYPTPSSAKNYDGENADFAYGFSLDDAQELERIYARIRSEVVAIADKFNDE